MATTLRTLLPRLGRAALGLLVLLALAGCGALDYVPWPSSGGGGRPANSVRRPATRPESDQAREPAREEARPSPPKVAPAPPGSGFAAFTPLRGEEAARMAASLRPSSQSLTSFSDLEQPLRISLAHASRMPQQTPALVRPTGSLTWAQLRTTLEELLLILPRLDAEPQLLAERFVWYDLAPRPLVTGYFSPEMEASADRAPGYEYPLYAPPPDPKQYDRRAVDVDGALAGQGLEIAWLKNPADAFLLQTEGGGVLRFTNGDVRGVHFAATNGYEFRGLGQILLDSGVLPKEKLGRESIRAWCAQNPAKALSLMAANRSYVYFRLTDTASEGSLGKPLTPLVSLATDPGLLPLGTVVALDVPMPAAAAEPTLRGLALAQDAGADIRGVRLDLYLGRGERAERLESGMRAQAALHLLVSKSALRAK